LRIFYGKKILEEAKAHLQGCGATDDDINMFKKNEQRQVPKEDFGHENEKKAPTKEAKIKMGTAGEEEVTREEGRSQEEELWKDRLMDRLGCQEVSCKVKKEKHLEKN
jgi:hypothetical protein